MHIIGEVKKGSLCYGRILKGVGGFYTVDRSEPAAEREASHRRELAGRASIDLWTCRLRGRFRREKQEVLPGDMVSFTVVDEAGRKGVVETVEPRKNHLLRPSVANVDQALIVLAADYPQPDLWLLDRLLLMIQAEDIQPLLCWNKADLAGIDAVNRYRKPYEAAEIRQIVTSGLTGAGVEQLGESLAGRTTVLAGPSGVGKSTLLNQIEPGILLKTGEISEKLGRGRHTTRHVEWIPLSQGGWVADTPGFSQMVLPEAIRAATLADYYPEFDPFLENCRFRSCIHDQEQDCGISQGVRDGEIDEGRYRRYLAFIKDLRERESRYR